MKKRILRLAACGLAFTMGAASVEAAYQYNENGYFAPPVEATHYWNNGEDTPPEDCTPTYVYSCPTGTFAIGGDWLYWKVSQEKMQIGAEVMASVVDGETFVRSSILTPKFKEQSGYRVFADYITPDNWKIRTTFNHVPTKASIANGVAPANIMFDFISLFNTNFPLLSAISSATFSSVAAKWDAHINYLDIDLSRKIDLCDNFQVTPHIGIRGLWIYQKFSISGIADGLTFTSAMRERIEGIGVEGGLWGSWSFAPGFSVFGNIGGAAIYAKVRNNGELIGTTDATSDISYRDNSYISLPMLDSFIGVRYESKIGKNDVVFHVAWEEHFILSTNQFSIQGGGGMTLQGLTLGGCVRF